VDHRCCHRVALHHSPRRQQLGTSIPPPRLSAGIQPPSFHIHGSLPSIQLHPFPTQRSSDLALEKSCPVEKLIEAIAEAYPPYYPLPSALRIYIAAYWRDKAGVRYLVDFSRGTRRARSRQGDNVA